MKLQKRGHAQRVHARTHNKYSRLLKILQPQSQKYHLMVYLIEHGSITPLEALKELDIYRLSGRIHELRDIGADIDTLRMEVTDRNGNRKTYAKYVLN